MDGRSISFTSESIEQNIVSQKARGHRDSSIETTMEEETASPASLAKFRPILILIPSILDMFEHVLRNISQILIAPSVGQMLRSSIVVFAAILCVLFLKKKLFRHHYASILSIILGLFFVGLSQALDNGEDPSSVVTYTGA